MILYIYKIIIGLVPNPGFEEFPYNDRTGLKVRAKQNRKAAPWVQNLRNSLLLWHWSAPSTPSML